MFEVFQETISSGLFLQEVMHGLFAIPFAALLWNKTRSSKLVILLFFVVYAVDIDHLFDYFAFYGFKKFSLLEFVSGLYFSETHQAFTPLHAWEWAGVLAILSKKRGWESYYTVVLFGYLPHLIYDSLNIGNFLFYSIIYRALVGFTFS